MRIILLSIISLIFSLSCPAKETIDIERLQNLSREIRCVVCQGQSIADSNAPIAKDMQKKIQLLMQAKKTDQEIKDYLSKRYGDGILLKPKFNQQTLLLWSFPALLLTGLALYLIITMLGNRNRKTSET